jgi:hypothetical protein
MSAAIKEAIRRMLATVCFMWLFETRENKDETWMTIWIYPRDIGWNDQRMTGNRLKIEFDIEPHASALAQPERGGSEKG